MNCWTCFGADPPAPVSNSPPPFDQRDDREHLRARAQLEDREEVGEVVAQDVAGDRDRVLAVLGPFEREAGRLGDGQDLDLQVVGVLVGECALDLLEDLGVVRAALVEPEHGGRPGRAGALDREPHPVGHRGVLGLAAAPDVAGLDVVLEQRVAGAVDDAHAAGGLDLEGLVVAAVLLGLLRHQADVGRGAHRRRVERAVLAAEVDRLRVEGGVAGVGDHGLGVLLVAVGVPHLARGADHRRHRGVDDHVAGDVQVGDAAVGVDHREVRAPSRRSP